MNERIHFRCPKCGEQYQHPKLQNSIFESIDFYCECGYSFKVSLEDGSIIDNNFSETPSVYMQSSDSLTTQVVIQCGCGKPFRANQRTKPLQYKCPSCGKSHIVSGTGCWFCERGLEPRTYFKRRMRKEVPLVSILTNPKHPDYEIVLENLSHSQLLYLSQSKILGEDPSATVEVSLQIPRCENCRNVQFEARIFGLLIGIAAFLIYCITILFPLMSKRGSEVPGSAASWFIILGMVGIPLLFSFFSWYLFLSLKKVSHEGHVKNHPYVALLLCRGWTIVP